MLAQVDQASQRVPLEKERDDTEMYQVLMMTLHAPREEDFSEREGSGQGGTQLQRLNWHRNYS